MYLFGRQNAKRSNTNNPHTETPQLRERLPKIPWRRVGNDSCSKRANLRKEERLGHVILLPYYFRCVLQAPLSQAPPKAPSTEAPQIETPTQGKLSNTASSQLPPASIPTGCSRGKLQSKPRGRQRIQDNILSQWRISHQQPGGYASPHTAEGVGEIGHLSQAA